MADHTGDLTEVYPAVTQQINQTVRTRCWPPSTILLLAGLKPIKKRRCWQHFFINAFQMKILSETARKHEGKLRF